MLWLCLCMQNACVPTQTQDLFVVTPKTVKASLSAMFKGSGGVGGWGGM